MIPKGNVTADYLLIMVGHRYHMNVTVLNVVEELWIKILCLDTQPLNNSFFKSLEIYWNKCWVLDCSFRSSFLKHGTELQFLLMLDSEQLESSLTTFSQKVLLLPDQTDSRGHASENSREVSSLKPSVCSKDWKRSY